MAIVHLVLLMTCASFSNTDATESRNISTDEVDIKNKTDAASTEIIETDEADIKNETDSGGTEIIQPGEAERENETDAASTEVIETDEADIKNKTDSGGIEIIQPGEADIKHKTDAASTEVIETDEADIKNKTGEGDIKHKTDAASTEVIETDEADIKNKTDSGGTEIIQPGEADIKHKTDAVCSCSNVLQSDPFDEEAVILKLKLAMTSSKEHTKLKSALRVLRRVVTRVQAASDSIKALTSRLDTLQAAVDGVKAQTNSLSPLTSRINTFQADVDDLKAKSGEVVDLKLTVSKLVQNVDTMNTTIGLLDQHIYFMTTFTNLTLRLEPGLVVFDLVLTNTGDAYNVTTGVFTAPRHGVYIFSAQSFSQSSTDANWDFYVNDHLVLRSRLVTTTDTSHNYVVPVTLQAGDHIYIKSRKSFGIYGINHSFFSGWLIKAF